MKPLLRPFLLLFSGLFFPLYNWAQQFNFKNFSVEDGVAQSQVYALCEDSRGYLWMGTRGGGLTRYDGLHFKSYTTRDGLGDNYISCIHEDKNHALWIGTNRGLCRYNGIRFENFFPGSDSSAIFRVQDIAESKEGVLWLATNHGIYTFDPDPKTNPGKKFGSVSATQHFLNENVYRIFIDSGNAVWAGGGPSGLGFCTFKNGQFSSRLFAKGSGIGKNIVQAISADKEGNIWVGTYGMGCFVSEGNGQFHRISKDNALDKKIILDIKSDSRGNMWIATLTDGVCRWDKNDSTLTFLRETEGLSNNHVRCILEDTRGDYWFGTSGGGICKYYGEQFTHFSKNNGLSGSFVYSVYRDTHGKLWLGSADKGLCEYDGAYFYPYGEPEGFRNTKVRAIAEDADSSLWFGTEGSGVYIRKQTDFHAIRELRGKYIKAILKDHENSMWVATAGAGIYKLTQTDPKQLKFEVLNFSGGPNSPITRVNCLAEDTQGRIWFGCESGGAGFIQNNKLNRIFTKTDGLASDGITSMTIDRAGYLWIGTAADGVSALRLSDPLFHFETINTGNGLTSGNVYLLCTDENDNLIIGTESGLDKLKLDGDRHLIELKHFGKAEGFLAIETCRNAVFKDKGGVLWFGTINGLTKFNPHNKTKNPLPPFIRITGVNLFYEPLEKTAFASFVGPWNQITQTFVFPHDQNHIGFDFTGINLSAPDNVHYQWKLDGFDKGWSPEVFRKDATYSNLPPGEYTFQVKASNEDGIWNSIPASIHFTILKPFWMKAWFITAYCVLLILILMGVFRWRVNAVKQKAAEEKGKLETEKTMLELEQKALRLQMNPHFIFNALNSIQAQITENNEQTARHYLAKFSRLMRMILENSRSSQITLEDEIKTLENYLSLEKFSSGDQFDYTIETDDQLNREEDSLPPMMIQPFVENAIIHGLKHLKSKGQINIRFARNGSLLECRIQDNGIGRKQAALLNKAQQDEHHKSTALIVTQERLDILQKEKHIRSLEITDLTDSSGNPAGTAVIIRIPMTGV